MNESTGTEQTGSHRLGGGENLKVSHYHLGNSMEPLARMNFTPRFSCSTAGKGRPCLSGLKG